jgi:rhodanese-related sulfurtransferase
MTAPGDIEVSPDEARRVIEEGDATVVDVRRPEERAEGTIEGALEIILDELTQRAGEIPRDRPVVFYCRSGSRSFMAAQAFRQAGYEAYSVAGGFEAMSKG